MPESSAEVAVKAAADSKPGTEKNVPLAALSEQRAKTRAANEQAEALQAELEKAKDGKIDVAALSPLVADLLLEARKAAEQEFEPLRQEVAKYKLANQLGLNEPQVDKVMAVKQKNPGLTDQQALLLAKSEHGNLFPQAQQPAWNRALHGALPVSGQSEDRNDKTVDHAAKMNEAHKSGDHAAARFHAGQLFTERFYRIKPHLRPRST
jgi:hypothetical protein